MSRRLLGRLVLMGLPLLLLLVAVEILSRLVVRSRTPAGMVFRDDIIYTYEPRATVSGVTLNNVGCVGDDLQVDRSEDLVTVLLLGGSTSFSENYVDVVRARLLELLGGIEVRVTACGKPRYTSHVNRVVFEQVASTYLPDVVVLYMGINDNIYNCFPRVDEVPRVGYFDWRSRRTSVFFELLYYHVIDKRLLSQPDFGSDHLRSPAVLRRSVEAIIDTACQHGVTVVVSTFAIAWPTDDETLRATIESQEPMMEHFWGEVESTRLGVDAHNRVMEDIAARESLALARVAEVMPRDQAHFGDMCHLTGNGNRVLGRVIGDAIAEALESRVVSTSDRDARHE